MEIATAAVEYGRLHHVPSIHNSSKPCKTASGDLEQRINFLCLTRSAIPGSFYCVGRGQISTIEEVTDLRQQWSQPHGQTLARMWGIQFCTWVCNAVIKAIGQRKKNVAGTASTCVKSQVQNWIPATRNPRVKVSGSQVIFEVELGFGREFETARPGGNRGTLQTLID